MVSVIFVVAVSRRASSKVYDYPPKWCKRTLGISRKKIAVVKQILHEIEAMVMYLSKSLFKMKEKRRKPELTFSLTNLQMSLRFLTKES